MTTTRQEFEERVERAVLNALDEVAENTFGQPRSGWTDTEIPALAPAIRNHAKRAFQRLTIDTSE